MTEGLFLVSLVNLVGGYSMRCQHVLSGLSACAVRAVRACAVRAVTACAVKAVTACAIRAVSMRC